MTDVEIVEQVPTLGWRSPVSDLQVCLLAVSAVVGAWATERWWQVLVALGCVLVTLRAAGVRCRRDLVVAAIVVIALGGLLSTRAWAAAHPRTLGPYQGWATLVSDPESFGPGVKAVLEIEGERFEAAVYGSHRRRLQARQAGERVEVIGERQVAEGPWGRRAKVRHIVGDIEVEAVGAWADGTQLSMASNRLRGALRASADGAMTDEQAALFTGLVIGDDTRQPDSMIDDFRTSGLSHLTAVSGQNVAFVLAVVGVGLRSLPRWSRLGATCVVVGWFVILTRIEPSVLRAGTMAAMSAAAFALGRERTATRTLGLAVILLVLIDPLLVWSVGFWLSVCATFGVSAIAPHIEPRLRGPQWLTAPLAITLGAQAGVVVPSWLVFHRMPVVGVLANLLAVPVAGFVMLYGIPAGLLAAMTPSMFDGLVMWPATVGTRWVSTVAALAARVEPQGRTALVCWIAQLALIVAVWRRRLGQIPVDRDSTTVGGRGPSGPVTRGGTSR